MYVIGNGAVLKRIVEESADKIVCPDGTPVHKEGVQWIVAEALQEYEKSLIEERPYDEDGPYAAFEHVCFSFLGLGDDILVIYDGTHKGVKMSSTVKRRTLMDRHLFSRKSPHKDLETTREGITQTFDFRDPKSGETEAFEVFLPWPAVYMVKLVGTGHQYINLLHLPRDVSMEPVPVYPEVAYQKLSRGKGRNDGGGSEEEVD